MAHSESNRSYFDIHKELQQRTAALADDFKCGGQVDDVAQHINDGNLTAALEELSTLKTLVNYRIDVLVKQLLDSHDSHHDLAIKYKVLQREEVEHARIFAEREGHQEIVSACDQALAWYDNWFAAQSAIADLDPDAVATGP